MIQPSTISGSDGLQAFLYRINLTTKTADPVAGYNSLGEAFIMHKLVIMVEQLPDEAQFDEMWPEFLHVSERMPGLSMEATCRVEGNIYGSYQPALLHELFFESVDDIKQAMSSPEGRTAGELLQRMTGGRMSLIIADHKEDNIENIRRYQGKTNDAG